MATAVTAVFPSLEEAQHAVTGLQEGGIPEGRISFDQGEATSGPVAVAITEGDELDREWVDSILVLFGGRIEA